MNAIKRLTLIIPALLLIWLATACAQQPAAAVDGAIETSPNAQEATATPTTAPVAEEAATAATETPSAPPEETAEEEAAEEEAAAEETNTLTFAIVPEESEARFRINEELFGDPKEVVGRTNAVTGELRVDPQNPAASEIGVISVDARSFTTDDSFRNRSLRRFILQSGRDEYQFVTFTPTQIEGMPDSVAVGEPIEIAVTGDLQIRDVVNPVTFAMTVTAVSETELTGIGRTTVLRPDFDLRIPDVPGVANVGEEVVLEIDFVARRLEE